MKRILSIGSIIVILVFILNCSMNDSNHDNSNSDIVDVDIQTDDNLEGIIVPPNESYQLSTLTPSLDFTEVLTDTAYIKLTNNDDVSYPYELSNSLEWLSFSNLTGTVHESEEIITAYVDFNQFDPQEIKEGNIIINSGVQSLTIPVTAQNYYYSDPGTQLDLDHNIFTIYNQSGDDLSFNIFNSSGSGTMIYSFTSDSEWLDFDLPPGYIEDSESVDIPVFIDWSLIEHETLSRGYITVTNHLDPVETDTITIKARSIPELYVSKTRLTQNSNASNSNTFEVGNNLALSLPYIISVDKEWVSFNQTSGSVIKDNNDIIEVYINYSDFIEGISKYATISIQSDYGNETIDLTATGYPSFKTSTVNIYMKSIESPEAILEIINTGCGVPEYNLSTESTFLFLSNTHGSLNHGESVEISISAYFEELPWDTYSYTEVLLQMNGEEKIFKVNVMREVDPEQDPRLYVNRSSINIDINSLTDESFIINNAGTGIMDYQIETSDPWILLSSTSGSITSELSNTITFTIDEYLLGDDRTGFIEINTNGVYNNYHIINVQVE